MLKNKKINAFIKIVFLIIVIVFSAVSQLNSQTSAWFASSLAGNNNQMKAGCWMAPSIPQLMYPENQTYSGLGSAWDQNPYLDWQESTSSCLETVIQYHYQSSAKQDFSTLAYNSSWLNNSYIPAPGTPEGIYYWRVQAKDNFGHVSDFSAPWLLIVDRTAPVAIINPLVANQTNNIINLGWSGTDNLSGIKDFDLQLKDNAGDWTDLLTATTSATYNFEGENGHQYSFRVRARDKADNLGLWSSSTNTTIGIFISGLKFNDENNNGNKDIDENGLAGWIISVSQKIEEFSVQAQNGPTITSQALEADQKYLIRVSGTYSAGDYLTCDAKYSIQSPHSTWTDLVQNYESYGKELLDLQIDGLSPDWGSYNQNHVYWISYDGKGTALNFRLNDFYPSNNSGEINVQIFKILNSTTTNSDGSYSLNIPELTGNIYIFETMQTGWLQTKPGFLATDKGFYQIDSNSSLTNLDFANIQVVSPQATADFYLKTDRKAVGFELTNISQYQTFTYEIIYSPTNRELQGIFGNVSTNGAVILTEQWFDLGTDSSGAWVYDTGMTTIHLKIVLSGPGLPNKIIEKDLAY